MQSVFGSTNRTCHRLSMKPAVVNIGVFFAAIVTHNEFTHGGFFTIIRQVLYNSEAWSAIGAVDKRIIYSVGLCFHVVETIVANRNVRTDISYKIGYRVAFYNLKICKINKFCLAGFDRFYGRGGGSSNADSLNKIIQCFFIAVDFNKNSIVTVFDFAFQIKFRSNPINKRTETDSLYQAFDMDEIGVQFFCNELQK